MTNHEKIQRAFDALKPERRFEAEPAGRRHVARLVPALGAVILALGVTVACAADLGGLRETLTVWILGRKVEATLQEDSHRYTLLDGNGDILMMGAGVSLEGGGERPLSAEEMADIFQNAACAETGEDGAVWFYYQDNRIDITRLFDGKGKALVEIPGERCTKRFTVMREEDGSYSVGMTDGDMIEEAAED